MGCRHDFRGAAASPGTRDHALIFQGGPFPYGKDGTVFGNRRGCYPHTSAGTTGIHRQEHQVSAIAAPGALGGGRPRTPDACYYTSDHYASFREIVE